MKQKAHILVSPLSYLRSDADVGDRRPGIEEIIEKLHEITLTDFASLLLIPLFFLCDHLEGNSSLVDIATAF